MTQRFDARDEHAPGDDHDRPAVVNPDLRQLVERARAQTVPRLHVDLETIRLAAGLRRRAHLRHAVVAIAAVLVGALGVSLLSGRMGRATHDTGTAAGVAPLEDPVVAVRKASATDARDVVDVPDPESVGETQSLSVPGLAPGVKIVRPTSDGAALPELRVDGPFEVELVSGSYHIEVAAEVSATLAVKVHERVLLVQPGSELEVDADAARVDVSRGTAHWRGGASGEQAAAQTAARTAAALARQAEAKMATGQRSRAITLLQTLVREHPRAPDAKTGLLDLARLQRVAGHADLARCAYRLYRSRYPQSRVAAEVDQAIAGLGPGPRCNGLRPRP